MAVCSKCNCAVADNENFCPNCKNEISARSSVVIVEDKSGSPTKRLLKVIIPLVAMVLALCVGIGVFCVYTSNEKQKNSILFAKENAVYLGSNRFESVKLSQVVEGSENNDVVYSEDGKKLFFPTEQTENGEYTLNCIDSGKTQEKTVVAKNVTSYQISANGKTVAYIKGSALYKSDLKESEKVMDKVTAYAISENGKKTVFLTTDGKLYVSRGDEKTKISTDVDGFVTISANNFADVHYTKNSDLYIYDGKKSNRIASNVSSVVSTYKSGEVHYIKAKAQKATLADFIADDKREEDEKFTDGASATALQGKQLRDQIRAQAKSMVIDIELSELYYYDGSNEKLVTDTLTSVICGSDKKAIAYVAYSNGAMEKIRISEIGSTEQLSGLVTERFFKETKNCVAIGDYSAVIEGESIEFNDDATKVYYISNRSIYWSSLSANNISYKRLYQNDADSFYVCGDTVVAYKKYLPDGEQYVYSFRVSVDGREIATNCQGVFSDWGNKYFCIIDKAENGVVKLIGYKDGNTGVIAENVDDAIVTPDGTFYYIVKGELFSYKKDKTQSIEKGISFFVIPNNYVVHNYLNTNNIY